MQDRTVQLCCALTSLGIDSILEVVLPVWVIVQGHAAPLLLHSAQSWDETAYLCMLRNVLQHRHVGTRQQQRHQGLLEDSRDLEVGVPAVQ